MSSVNCYFRGFLNTYEPANEEVDLGHAIGDSQSEVDLTENLCSSQLDSSSASSIPINIHHCSNFDIRQLTGAKRNSLDDQENDDSASQSKKQKFSYSLLSSSSRSIFESDVITPGVVANRSKIEPIAAFNELELQSVRIGLIFALLPFKFSDVLVKTVVEYDLDSYYDIINVVQEESEVSDSLKRIMNSTTILDLGLYPVELANLAQTLKLFKNVEIFTMPRIATYKCLGAIVELKKLSELSFAGCVEVFSFGAASFAWLASKFPLLKSLNLSYCSNVTDKSCVHIAKLQSLNSLNLVGCDDITDTNLEYLVKNLPNLRILELRSYSITDAWIALAKVINPLLKINNNLSINYGDETEVPFETAEADDSWNDFQ